MWGGTKPKWKVLFTTDERRGRSLGAFVFSSPRDSSVLSLHSGAMLPPPLFLLQGGGLQKAFLRGLGALRAPLLGLPWPGQLPHSPS